MNKILENVFTSCFPAILNKCSFGISSREIFYLSHEMTDSVEAAKSSFLNVRMKGYAFKCTWIALQQFSSMKLNPAPCQCDPGMSCRHSCFHASYSAFSNDAFWEECRVLFRMWRQRMLWLKCSRRMDEISTTGTIWREISERLVLIIKTIRCNLDKRLLADWVTSYLYIS